MPRYDLNIAIFDTIRYIVPSLLNTVSDEADVTSFGRPFHTFAPATRKARPLTVARWQLATTSTINWFTVHCLPRCMECRRGIAMRILSVGPSVCQSVTRMDCNKTVERSVQIYIPYERTFSLVFWEEWLVEGDPFYVKFWVNRAPLERNRRFSTDIRP